jgi:hypothetical protein
MVLPLTEYEKMRKMAKKRRTAAWSGVILSSIFPIFIRVST